MPSVAHRPSRRRGRPCRARGRCGSNVARLGPGDAPPRPSRRLAASRSPVAARAPADAACRAMRFQRVEQFVQTPRGEGADDLHPGLPVAGRGRSAQAEHLAHFARGLLGERQVALADGEHVGDLERAGLDRLDSSPSPGGQTTTRVSASATIAVSDWPVPTVSTMTRSKPRVEAVDRRARRARQAAELAAGRERADEGVRMRRVRTHADAVAEDRAAADRARRVDGDHGHGRSSPSQAPSSASTSVDLPLPGTPVMPTTQARGARPASWAAATRAPGAPSSIQVSRRASAPRSPAIARSASRVAGVGGRHRQTTSSGWPKPRSRRRRPQISSFVRPARAPSTTAPKTLPSALSAVARQRVERTGHRGVRAGALRRGERLEVAAHRGSVRSLDRRARPGSSSASYLLTPTITFSPASTCRWLRIAEAPIIRCTSPDSTALYMPPASSTVRMTATIFAPSRR